MRSIATYPLAALCGLAMVLSLFLKWFKLPDEMLALFGGAAVGLDGVEGTIVPEVQSSFGPSDLMEMGLDLETLFQDPIGIAVAASFLIAAAVAILGFLGGMVPRIFAILGGILPFGIVGWGYFQMREQAQGLPIPQLSDLTGSEAGLVDGLRELTPFIGLGFYAYFGGALVLLLLGLFSPGKRQQDY